MNYPPGSTARGRVVLFVTIQADGRVSAVEVDESLEPAIDDAATRAVQKWKFSPARRDGKPVAARVRVAVPIEPPHPVTSAPPAAGPSGTDARAPSVPPGPEGTAHPGRNPAQTSPPADDVHMQVTVHGERPLRTEKRSVSDFFIHREVLGAAPHAEGVDALRASPGLTLFRTEGLAVAPSYSLRGFDAEHGQDIEFIVGGLPINLPSHIHGQGYADLGFLIGEIVDQLSVSEGVSDPEQGDFAVAGSIAVGLGVDEDRRGLQLQGSYGSFDTLREQVIWAPKEADRESVGAAQYTTTDGFGENRSGKTASGIVQHRFGDGAVRYRAVGFVHAARANSAGVLRQDDIDSGRVCFHCVYPFATARAQNGSSQRAMAGFFADYRGPKHANGSIGVWVGHDDFRLQENFTGFLEASRTLPGVAGRGDLIEQRNGTSSLGLTGRYRTEAFEPASWAHGTLEVGLDGRTDTIDQGQNLLDGAVRNQTWDRRVDADIRGVDIGLWGDLDFQLGTMVHARLGARTAVLSYQVDDRLGNFAPLTRPQDQFLPGFRRSAIGATVGPRASVEVQSLDWFGVLASYGEGYRSPQARTLADGESAPFAKVRSGDAGVRLRFGSPLDVTLAGYATHLSDDVAFDASEGRLERVGPTRRLGAVGYALSRPVDWFVGALSVTYVDAVLLEAPPPTAEEPDPPFVDGQSLPFVPPWVIRLDSVVETELGDATGAHALVGRVGAGFSFLAGRPLPFDQRGEAVYLLDASAGLGWGPVDLNLSAFNLLDLNYAAREYFFVSDWSPDEPVSRVPARHIAAGAPFSLLATVGVNL